MADIKKGSDLITTMGATEARLKKVERQLAVPRRGDASYAPEVVTTTGGPLSDPVSIVLTAKCLIHIFATFELKADTVNRMLEVGVTIQGADPLDYAARSITRFGSASGFAPTSYQVFGTTAREWQLSSSQNGLENKHPITLANQRNPAGLGADLTAGKYTVTMTTSTDGTLSIRSRRLFAWVQPF
jgi:hypothetical protein